jgi:hypothetical protein
MKAQEVNLIMIAAGLQDVYIPRLWRETQQPSSLQKARGKPQKVRQNSLGQGHKVPRDQLSISWDQLAGNAEIPTVCIDVLTRFVG